MTRRARLGMFAIAGPGLAAVLVIAFRGLPAFGHYHGVYGLVVNGVELSARHATDFVTALNFDIRAFDTLGEEFILFASVLGVTLLLRVMRFEDEIYDDREHGIYGSSDAVRVLSLLLIPIVVALGVYIVIHGVLTPGGGFQGGIVLATAPALTVLAGRYVELKAIAPDWALEAAEGIGAAGYALFGLGGLVFAGVYMKNFLPAGNPGQLLSGGFMPLNSIAVGLEVAGAFLIVWTAFLDQALLVRPKKEDDK
ncbi:MAG: MnhB domain-containing protein [Solirubrobacteraceae bacterium]